MPMNRIQFRANGMTAAGQHVEDVWRELTAVSTPQLTAQGADGEPTVIRVA